MALALLSVKFADHGIDDTSEIKVVLNISITPWTKNLKLGISTDGWNRGLPIVKPSRGRRTDKFDGRHGIPVSEHMLALFSCEKGPSFGAQQP